MKGSSRVAVLRMARKCIVAVAGSTLLVIGVALIVLPGPAMLVIPAGLGLLATEFVWARRLLARVKKAVVRSPFRARPNSEPRFLRAGRPLVLVMFVVVISFIASLWVSHRRLAEIEDQASEIAANAVPSIEHLSSARVELRRLGMYANEYVTSASRGQDRSRAPIRASRDRLDTELLAHRALATFDGEREQLAPLPGELGALDQALRTALDEADSGQLDAARSTLQGPFHETLERIDDRLQRVLLLNGTYARTRSAEIISARRRAVDVALFLGGLSTVGAALMSMLALAALRSRARLVEERVHLLSERATELEAFAGRVAHDLRNPLGAIKLRIATTQRSDGLSPKARDALDKTDRQIERMGRVIDGLLEFARAGAKPTPGASSDLREVINEVVSDVYPAAVEVGADLHVPPFEPVNVACTSAGLTSVLSNLLRNAIKYITNGRQPVRRIAVHVTEQDDAVCITVEDTGPGLPVGSEQLVFEPFQRFATGRPGVGLGLATVKRIVEAYGGCVGVRSVEGQGCSFWFVLPKAKNPITESNNQGNVPIGDEQRRSPSDHELSGIRRNPMQGAAIEGDDAEKGLRVIPGGSLRHTRD